MFCNAVRIYGFGFHRAAPQQSQDPSVREEEEEEGTGLPQRGSKPPGDARATSGLVPAPCRPHMAPVVPWLFLWAFLHRPAPRGGSPVRTNHGDFCIWSPSGSTGTAPKPCSELRDPTEGLTKPLTLPQSSQTPSRGEWGHGAHMDPVPCCSQATALGLKRG